jgi:high-affinity iron transporter
MVRAKCGRWIVLLLALSTCLFFAPWSQISAASNNELLIIVGDALVKAKTKDWSAVEEGLQRYQQLWNGEKEKANATARKEIDQSLAQATSALKAANSDPEKVFQSISQLAKATDQYLSSQQQTSKKSGKEKAKQLITRMQKCLDLVNADQMQQAKTCNQQFANEWAQHELLIRHDAPTVYGLAETKMSLVRIYVQAEPADQAKVKQAMQDLIQVLQDYVSGSAQTNTTNGKDTLPDVIKLLTKADQLIASGKLTEAADQMQLFIQKWPNVEGVVQVKAPELYTQIENQMAEASSYLLSNPPQTQKAAQVIQNMKTSLQSVSESESYTAWDAGIVLFREGLEAVCILAAFLVYLKQANHQDKQKWIWSGAATGIVLSVGMALLLHLFMSTVSAGSTREMIEGITGIVAVIMMIIVGVWLHSQAHIQNRNRYVKEKMGTALATGSLWSLFAVSALSVLREGAETILFYMGMAPSIETRQLIIGIVGAILLLVIIGYFVITLSSRIPLRPFFMIAAFFIYYLTIKFTGQSIHSLQVANQFSSHPSAGLPTIDWLGIYPTWESLFAQVVILLMIVGLAIWNGRTKAEKI